MERADDCLWRCKQFADMMGVEQMPAAKAWRAAHASKEEDVPVFGSNNEDAPASGSAAVDFSASSSVTASQDAADISTAMCNYMMRELK